MDYVEWLCAASSGPLARCHGWLSGVSCLGYLPTQGSQVRPGRVTGRPFLGLGYWLAFLFLRLVPGLHFEGVALISLALGVEMGKDYLFLFGWLSQQTAVSWGVVLMIFSRSF